MSHWKTLLNVSPPPGSTPLGPGPVVPTQRQEKQAYLTLI